jgi:endonuclease/exonuclease/phosphatase family metal-dependent hydrolase
MEKMDMWRAAIRAGHVFVIPGGAKAWRPVERLDQLAELDRWRKGEPREKGWLILKSGVPSHFVKRDGTTEPLAVNHPLRIVAYNLLTSTADGDENALSMFERELTASGKYRYWKNRKQNVIDAVRRSHVAGLCEVTRPMLKDVLAGTGLKAAAFALKVDQYDGSAILVDPCVTVREVVTHRLGGTQILLAARLRMDAEFWFVVLHLKSDGTSAHGSLEHVRVKQARAANKFLDTLSPLPIVVVGDFNSDRFLYPGFRERGTTHVMEVFDTYESVLPLAPTYTHYREAAFDHIIIRGGFATNTHVPASGVAPNSQQGSDHLPVYADVHF